MMNSIFQNQRFRNFVFVRISYNSIFFLLFSFFFFPIFIFSQVNLVPDPSFESDDNAPVITQFNWNHYSDWRKDSVIYSVDNSNFYTTNNINHYGEDNTQVLALDWFPATKGTPDYLNSDQSNLVGFKTKTARTGSGRMGIISGIAKNGLVSWLFYKDTYAEYIECKLNKPLDTGKVYCVRYYVALDRKSNFCSNHFGAIISREKMDSKSHTSMTMYENDLHVNNEEDHFITSDEGWVMICDTFISKGGEQYLTLGSFSGEFPKRIHSQKKSQHAGLRVGPFNKFAYYYVDDVSLMLVKPDEQLCEAPRDTGTRDNLVFMIDVSGSMEPKGNIAAAKSAILPLISSLPPGDHISIIAFSDNPVVLCDNITAADTSVIRKSLDSIVPGGGTNVVGAFRVAYQLIRKRMLTNGTNKIVVLTDGGIALPKSEEEKIVAAKKNEGITLSIIFFGKKIPKEVLQLAHAAGGDASATKEGNADEALQKQIPAHVLDTKYGTRNANRILKYELLTKVLFPGLLALLILRATRTI